MLGAGGAYLSGGEVQRVALARAILKDAPIVVLDEAPAFADPENEALIQRAFSKLAAGRTVIMIAHRLSTVVGADQIVVLNQGSVQESGTHAGVAVPKMACMPRCGPSTNRPRAGKSLQRPRMPPSRREARPKCSPHSKRIFPIR